VGSLRIVETTVHREIPRGEYNGEMTYWYPTTQFAVFEWQDDGFGEQVVRDGGGIRRWDKETNRTLQYFTAKGLYDWLVRHNWLDQVEWISEKTGLGLSPWRA
jgi:hypothetical protein